MNLILNSILLFILKSDCSRYVKWTLVRKNNLPLSRSNWECWLSILYLLLFFCYNKFFFFLLNIFFLFRLNLLLSSKLSSSNRILLCLFLNFLHLTVSWNWRFSCQWIFHRIASPLKLVIWNLVWFWGDLGGNFFSTIFSPNPAVIIYNVLNVPSKENLAPMILL